MITEETKIWYGLQEHPDTVGGAMRMLKGASEEEANAAAGAVDGGLPSRKRKQVGPRTNLP